ncbi:MAG: hypothetical protein JNM84_14960 [Planctomycetes bacterium]|nr:hypothetical protein [Planctomycetota bacterium]
MSSADRSAVVVVLGETGHGKTVLLAHLIQVWMEGVPGGGRAELLPDAEEKQRRSLATIEAFAPPGRRTTAQAVEAITRSFEEGRSVEGTAEPEDFFVQWHAGELAAEEAAVVRLRDVPGYVFEEGERWELRGHRAGELLRGCAGLVLVLDLSSALEAAESSRFAARVQRYVHALSAAEVAARRAGLSALPVVLFFTRADRETREVALSELRERPALRPLFAALEDRSRRVASAVQIVSCLRYARDEASGDRAALAAGAAQLGAGLARGLAERRVRRRRQRLAAGLGALLLVYAAWVGWASLALRPSSDPEEVLELQVALDELAARERAEERFGAFPWWPGKDRAGRERQRAALEERALVLLRDHPALREEESRCERTRAEYATARRALQRLRPLLEARGASSPGGSPSAELLLAKEELARLEPPSARNLHEWEAALRAVAFPALRARFAESLGVLIAEELERLDLVSRKVDFDEELADLRRLREFRAAHLGSADPLVEARLEREWEHLRFLLDRAREGASESPARGFLLPLAQEHEAEHASGTSASAYLLGEIAFELGRALAVGARAEDREALAVRCASGSEGAALARDLARAVPRVYDVELLRWNGAEGRAFLTRRLAGLRELVILLRPHAPNAAAAGALAAFDEHLQRLEVGAIGPYRLWLRRLVADAGDEPFWMRIEVLDDRGRFERWRELGGLAQPVLRLVRPGDGSGPFVEGALEPGVEGWSALAGRWEGRVPIGPAFEHQAGRALRLEIADRGSEEHPRPPWLAWVVADVEGVFAPERFDARTFELTIPRPEGGTQGAKKPEQRYHPAANQVLRLELEVELDGRPLRDQSSAFSFSAWTLSW